MSAIIIEGGIVHYEVVGRGRPVIFLHSWLGSWRYWMSALQTTSTSFRAYALDLWGFGDSGREREHYALRAQVELLEGFLAEMGIGKVALVGHGLGGLVSLVYGMRFPETVDRVMAINTPREFSAISARMKTAPLSELTDWLTSKTAEFESVRADTLKADQLALSTAFSEMESAQFTLNSEQITLPCLFVQGQSDPAISPFEYETSAENLHQIFFEQSGHFPMIEEGMKFNRLLTDWLALGSGESPRELQLNETWRRRVR